MTMPEILKRELQTTPSIKGCSISGRQIFVRLKSKPVSFGTMKNSVILV